MSAGLSCPKSLNSSWVWMEISAALHLGSNLANKCPELKNPAKMFDLDQPDLEIFQKFPKWIQEKMQGNLNYKGSKLEKLLGGKAPAPAPAPEKEDPPFDPDDNAPY